MKSGLHFLTFAILFSYLLADNIKKPTVLISILVRNKGHGLPYFLTYLEELNYPKHRMSLWIRSDHNVDNSIDILKVWIESVKDQYHSIHTEFETMDTKFPDEKGIADWTDDRFTHVMNQREAGLMYGRKIWADYLLSIDADVFLTNPETLNYLISKRLMVVSPMLQSNGLYSNFWHGMTEDYYYQRTDDYKPILYRQNTSCYNVPMVHSCILVDLRLKQSDLLTYRPEKVPHFDGPHDDIIVFALSAKFNDIPLYVCNEEVFGYIPVPLEPTETLEDDFEKVLNIKMDILNAGLVLHVGGLLEGFIATPEKDTFGFDKVFMINLKRRPDRKERMHRCFNQLGLQAETIDAVDGRALNESFLKTISFMPDFYDPYHKRPMKLGEIGCFLSHYRIWERVLEERLQTVMILEDDIRFEPYFRKKIEYLMAEVRRMPDWDLVYLGRKKLQDQDEPWVEGSKYLVEVGYSYWTLGYILSWNGARKLVSAEPLSKLVPVDEYLPILFDRHPQESWKKHFPRRDLVAFSVAPLLLFPTHYTGEKGYISDTEDSVVIPTEIFVKEDL
ncbi:glycosyltransferase 25 family member isoform X1 [Rhynchophorus ferrugineus]|uniref:glycosyltransferase 25 family member isoform X1 n=2 Tax=Rhynchophorus ferrugineus TaxID=354439 RepID=UPI003FCDBCAF